MAERTIAALHLSGTGDLARVARATVADAAAELGLDAGAAGDLAAATGDVVAAVASGAFDEPSDVELDVSVLRVEGSVAVRIDDLGLPFGFEHEGDVFDRVLASGWVDEAHHSTRGEEGNRTELLRHLDHATDDVRVDADPAEHAAAHAAPPVPTDAVIGIRPMVVDDAEHLARLTWRTYGYSYQHHEFYRPDLLAQMLDDDTLHSWVGEAEDGEIVGHAALMLDDPDALVVERGRVMVDPRYRGHHLMSSMYQQLLEWATARGMFGRYSDAVTAHTRSQQLWGDENQPATGLLLGYLPPTVTFRRIHDDGPEDGQEDGPARRQAILIGYHQLRPHPDAIVYPPAVDAEWIRRIYDANELPRSFGDVPDGALASATRLEAKVWRDVGTAQIVVHEPGEDLHATVRGRLRAASGAGVEVVYADLPLAHPGTPTAADVLGRLGFSFGGIVPLLRDGSDVLRYQRVVDLDVDPGDIHLYGHMAQDLLAYVLARRDAVS